MHAARTKKPRGERWLALALVLFTLLWPLERRRLFLTEHSFVTGAFTETGTLALYASDIAFFLVAFFWILWRSSSSTPRISSRLLWIGGIFLAYALIQSRSVWSGGPELIGVYASARIAQGLVLAWIVSEVWNVSLFRKSILFAMMGSSALQASLGIAQSFRGEHLGLGVLGEPPISLTATGVAKVDFIQQNDIKSNVPSGTTGSPLVAKFLRSYGTFPHANVLGMFLVASFFGTLLLMREQQPKNARLNQVMSYILVLAILLEGILLSFSRTAWLSLVLLSIGIWLYYRWESIHNPEAYNARRSYESGNPHARGRWILACARMTFRGRGQLLRSNVDSAILFIVLSSVIVSVGTLLAVPEVRLSAIRRIVPLGTDDFFEQRLRSYRDAKVVISQNPLFGSGTGLYIPYLVRNVRNIDKQTKIVHESEPRKPWEYSPPHNVFLLVAAEIGLVGLALFLLFIVTAVGRAVVRNAPRGRRLWHLAAPAVVVVGLSFPLLTDHYLWTTQQGRVLLWGILGLLAAMDARRGSPTADRRSTVQ